VHVTKQRHPASIDVEKSIHVCSMRDRKHLIIMHIQDKFRSEKSVQKSVLTRRASFENYSDLDCTNTNKYIHWNIWLHSITIQCWDPYRCFRDISIKNIVSWNTSTPRNTSRERRSWSFQRKIHGVGDEI